MPGSRRANSSGAALRASRSGRRRRRPRASRPARTRRLGSGYEMRSEQPSRRPRGIRQRPRGSEVTRAGRVDYRAGEDAAITAVLVDRVHDERLRLPAARDDLISTLTSDTGDGRAVEHPVAQSVGERGKVLADPLSPGRVAACWRRPAGRLEKASRCGIGELRPPENSRTCPHSDTAAPAEPPRSTTTASTPRSVRWAAAARPCGPAPMTTTGSSDITSPQIEKLQYENTRLPIEVCQYVSDYPHEPSRDHRAEHVLRAAHHRIDHPEEAERSARVFKASVIRPA